MVIKINKLRFGLYGESFIVDVKKLHGHNIIVTQLLQYALAARTHRSFFIFFILEILPYFFYFLFSYSFF